MMQEKRQQLNIPSTPGRMMRERGDRMPHKSKYKERFMRREKEPIQKSSSSTEESDNRGSGANILPPNVMKEQAEETDLKETFEDL